jgi:ATP-binding cassette subfamily B protein
MRLLWEYLRPHRALVALALVLAAISQVLALVDPIIFGWIVDGYATHRAGKTHAELEARGRTRSEGARATVRLSGRSSRRRPAARPAS